jgi:outer membrane lipoprotein carrier protein
MSALKLSIAVTVLLCGLQGAVHAENSETLEARQAVQAFLDSATRYSARFVQQLVDEEGVVLEEGSGEFWMQRPDKFRWHYAPPMERVLVSDGTRIWLHDVELEQITVRSADGALEQTPAGLLVGSATALDNYHLSIRERLGKQILVGLKPKNAQSDFQDIVLGLESNKLVRLMLADRFGQQTVIQFTDIRLDPPIAAALFSFEIPPGTDVIDQTEQ